MKYESMILAGSSGSIGTQAAEVAQKLGVKIEGISSFGHNINLIEEQVRRFSPSVCAICGEEAASELKIKIADTNTKIISGKYSSEEMVYMCSSPIVLNSVMGKSGLSTTLAAINTGKNVALANKETIVVAGELVMKLANEKNVKIIPVDSEHCAIAQCLKSEDPLKVSRIILTASGGPFFGKNVDFLKKVTPNQTLAHPTWKMGRRISVDSATLMNKGFELIEAAHLFDIPQSKIHIVIHRESIIHSAVEYIDNTLISQMSLPDMRSCIQYALAGNERLEGLTGRLDLEKIGSLSFYPPDTDTFTLLPLARGAMSRGGIIPAVLNAADEKAVELFLNNKISFTDIFALVEETVSSFANSPLESFEDAEKADKSAREAVDRIHGRS